MYVEIGDNILERCDALQVITQVDYYYGQFDNLGNVLINPPAVFLDYQNQDEGPERNVEGEIFITLHVAISALEHEPRSALKLVEALKAELNDSAIHDRSEGGNNAYIAKCFYKGFRLRTDVAGLIVYEVYLKVVCVS